MKKYLKQISALIFFIIFSTLIYALPTAICDNNPYQGGNWTINESTYCYDGELNISGDIIVNNSANFTLRNITLNFNLTADNGFGINLKNTAYGMFVYDSIIQSNSLKNYTWKVNSSFIMNNSIVKKCAGVGLTIHSDSNIINNSLFEDNNIGIYINGNNNIFSDLRFNNNGYGVFIESNSNNNSFYNITLNKTKNPDIWLQSNISSSEFKKVRIINSSSTSFKISNNINTTIENSNIQQSSSISFSLGLNNILKIYNTTVEGTPTQVFSTGINNNIQLYNISFDRTRITLQTNSNITLYHYVRFNITDNSSKEGIADVNLTVISNSSLKTYTSMTGSSPLGLTPWMTILEGIAKSNFDGVHFNISYNKYNLTLENINYAPNWTMIAINHSRTYPYTLTPLDTIPPIVDLTSPTNNSVFSTSLVSFLFTVTDERKPLLNCSLYIDNLFQINTTATNNTAKTINITLSDENHSAYISCDDALNTANSTIINFLVDTTTPSIDSYTANATINETQTININFTFSDATSSIDNYSITINSSRLNLTVYSDSYNLITDYFSMGNYTVTFSVNDSVGYVTTRTSMITVLNLPAAPNIISHHPNETIFLIEGETTILNFTYDDPDNNIIYSNITIDETIVTTTSSYSWNTTNQGTYNITFNILDGDGLRDSEYSMIIVNDTVPNADFNYSPINPAEGIDIIYFFDNSTKEFDNITSWFWDFGDGTNSTNQNPTHSYLYNGTYLVNLTVTDSDGSNNTKTKSIVIDDMPVSFQLNAKTYNTFPITGYGNLNENIVEIQIPKSLEFNASILTGNPPFSYYWDFNDTNSSAEQNPINAFIHEGIYNMTITITDNDGDIASSWIIINATAEPDTEPPIFSSLSPTNNSFTNNENISIYFIVTDDKQSFLNCSLYFNAILNMTSTAYNNSETYFNISHVPEGIHIWNINCTDYTNHVVSEERLITVDKAFPSIASFSLSPTTVKQGETITSSCIATDNLDSSLSKTINNLDTDTLGTRIATCTVTDDSGNSVTSIGVSYTIEKKTTYSSGGISPPPQPIEPVIEEPPIHPDTQEDIEPPQEEPDLVDQKKPTPIETEETPPIFNTPEIALPGIDFLGESEKKDIKTKELNKENFEDLVTYSNSYDVKRSYEYINNTTVLKYNVTNRGLVAFKRFGLEITIPKELANTTDNIYGDFHIIEKDPKILFILYNISKKSTEEISFMMNGTLSDEDIKSIIHQVRLEISDEEIALLMQKANTTTQEISITKKVISFENSTDVRITVDPRSNVENLTVLLEIPKCLAETLAEIEFEREDYEIIKDDPLIAFTYASLSDRTDIKFEVLKSVDPECWEQIKTLPIAEIIKDKIIVNDNKKIFYGLGIVLLINIFAISFNIFQRKTKKEKKNGILHKIEFGIVETILILIIVLNIIDFMKLLTPDFDFAKKILSLSVLGILLYEAKLEKILYGRENKFETLIILLANFLLLMNVFIDFVFIAYNEVVEQRLTPLVLNLYQVIVDFEIHNPGMISAYSMILGVSIIIIMSLIDMFKDIKSPSLMESLHMEGKPKTILPMIERFFVAIIIYLSFYIIFFRYFMEWLALTVDATLMVLAVIIYGIRFILKHAKHYHEKHIISKVGNIGEEFYLKFINLFKYKYTILFGLAGILVLHLLVDVSNYLIPFIFNFQEVIYFSHIGTAHPNMIFIFNKLFTENLLFNGIIVLSYLLNISFLLLCLVFPGYLWYDIYKNHTINIPKIWLGFFFAAITNYLLNPLIAITSIESNKVLGVDIVFRLSETQWLMEITLISLLVGVIVYFLSMNLIIRTGIKLLGSVGILLFFSSYVFFYLKSWIKTVSPQIIELLMYINPYSLFLGSLLSFFLSIMILFYSSSYVYFIRLIYVEWFKKKYITSHIMEKNKEVIAKYHDKGYSKHKLVDIIKDIDRMRKKEMSDLEIKEKLYEKELPTEMIEDIIYL